MKFTIVGNKESVGFLYKERINEKANSYDGNTGFDFCAADIS